MSWVIHSHVCCYTGIRYHKMTPSFIFKGIQMVSTNSSSAVHLHLNRECIATKSKQPIISTTQMKKTKNDSMLRFSICLFCIFFSSFHFGKIKMWFHVVFYAHHMMPYRFGCRQKASNHLVRRLKLNNKHFLNMMKTTELKWSEWALHVSVGFISIHVFMLIFCWKIYWPTWISAKKCIVTYLQCWLQHPIEMLSANTGRYNKIML